MDHDMIKAPEGTTEANSTSPLHHGEDEHTHTPVKVPSGDVRVGNAIMLSPIRKFRAPVGGDGITKTPARRSALKARFSGMKRFSDDPFEIDIRMPLSPIAPSFIAGGDNYPETPSKSGKRVKIPRASSVLVINKRRKMAATRELHGPASPVKTPENQKSKSPNPWTLDERNVTPHQPAHGSRVDDVMSIITPPSRSVQRYSGFAPNRRADIQSPFQFSAEDSPISQGLVKRANMKWLADEMDTAPDNESGSDNDIAIQELENSDIFHAPQGKTQLAVKHAHVVRDHDVAPSHMPQGFSRVIRGASTGTTMPFGQSIQAWRDQASASEIRAVSTQSFQATYSAVDQAAVSIPRVPPMLRKEKRILGEVPSSRQNLFNRTLSKNDKRQRQIAVRPPEEEYDDMMII